MARVQIHEGSVSVDIEVPTDKLPATVASLLRIQIAAYEIEAWGATGSVEVVIERKEKL